MKITLFLMTEKGYNVLQSIIEGKMTTLISKVVVGIDKNLDKDYSNEIIELCNTNAIQVEQRSATVKVESEYSLAVSWRWIIPGNTSKLIVIHDSLLPRYRGFAPLVNMLINKEEKIGVTALFANDLYDRGDIISQSSSPIEYPITIEEAIKKISKNYIEVVSNILLKIKNNETLQTYEQDETQASYSLWRDNNDYRIDWEMQAEEILTLINAVSAPYSGALTLMNGSPVRILEAEVEEDVHIENRDAGKIIFIRDYCPIVVCGKDLLKITNMIDDDSKETVLPLNKFRIRFT